jgi:16S rRNA (guanine527-N7)-methyltransferase
VPEQILKYFPSLSDLQKDRLFNLKEIYTRWNAMINLISRKDMENFITHHVLHSMSIAKIISFSPGTRILDVGTGGGFPGIPLAVMFPDAEFTLLDSIEKKIKVVNAVKEELKLENVVPSRKRVEDEKGRFDFVISRAVTAFPEFVNLTTKNINIGGKNSLRNGIIYLKGGDFEEELAPYKKRVNVWDIKDFYSEPFFETKKIIYLSF